MKQSLVRFARRCVSSFKYRLKGGERSIYLDRKFPQYRIGRGSYGDLKVLDFGEGSTLSIGSYCSFAVGAQVFLGGEHRVDWVSTYPFSAIRREFSDIKGHPRTRGNVVIGNDVWFGREAMVMSGVTIGDGAVIGARALVTKDVPAYAIVAGSPATLVRFRFPPEIVERLLAIAWWNWDAKRVDGAVRHLLSNDIMAFIDAAEDCRL
jgi:chloramphenicol O-acetyltransferase type B